MVDRLTIDKVVKLGDWSRQDRRVIDHAVEMVMTVEHHEVVTVTTIDRHGREGRVLLMIELRERGNF